MTIRLFVAIRPPEDVADEILPMMTGVPGARWIDPDDLHLTLRFIGEVDGLVFQDVDAALAALDRKPFTLTLSGTGHFPPRGQPRSLWVGVEPCQPLIDLRNAVDRAVLNAGQEPERRKFSPHVTIARLDGTPSSRVARFLSAHALYRSRPFEVDAFHLFSSDLHRKGAHYTLEETYPLGA